MRAEEKRDTPRFFVVELNELFNLHRQRVIPLGQTSSIAFPFSRLDREPFWELVPQPGRQ